MNIKKRIRQFTLIIVTLLVWPMFKGVLLAEEKKEAEKAAIGERFHAETSMTWAGTLAETFQPKPKQPAQFKSYPQAKKIKLPEPDYNGVTVEQAVKKRRSVRNYSKKPLSISQLSQLLFAAQGITGKTYGQALRSAPSAGASYPYEIYVVANNVKDLPQGIYHYSVLDHSIELVKEGDFRSQIVSAGLKQDMLGNAGVTFIMSAIFDRVRYKYGERGFRYVYIEAGHISQNIYLQSVSLGLGSVCVGAFLDDKVNELIELDGKQESTIYLHAVGCL